MKSYILGSGEMPDGELSITIHELIDGKYIQTVGVPLSAALMKANSGLFASYAGALQKIRRISQCINALAA
ncbi:hypothetical protein SOASR030_02350 [Leminorella grimontii]|uniref:Uncharacterized protein n=1 Tax=Leminorella grimontii TaxID=82981 RepID=A0AAV5MXY1_9GAMM|nr:hypothetical protein [Leminorella grimontii]GKX54123.1 hypothetical protein SOASR030_02350 [Leminorella grimontii]VFS60005.1 Uncharacterised protein [Leminorella grimontii]